MAINPGFPEDILNLSEKSWDFDPEDMKMNTKKTFFSLLYIGFSMGAILGVVLTAVITTLVIHDENLHLYTTAFSRTIENPLAAFLVHSFACGLLGMIMLGAAMIYEIDEWDLLKATTVHFIIIIISFYLAAFSLRWFSPTNLKAVCASLIMFVAMYSCIWLSQYLSCKEQVKEINRQLTLKKYNQQNEQLSS